MKKLATIAFLVFVNSYLYSHEVNKKMSTPLTGSSLHFTCQSQSPKGQGFCDGAIEAIYSLHGS